ncbi:hypothetical protein AB3S75_008784 [Citrus x aurantiifolia]
MGLLIRSYQFFSLQLLLLHSLSYAKHCPREQSSALIQFKQLFSCDEDSFFVCQRSYPKMISWKKDTNCCSWDGVTCDMATGNVISLDLSCSWLHGNIPPTLVSFIFFIYKHSIFLIMILITVRFLLVLAVSEI